MVPPSRQNRHYAYRHPVYTTKRTHEQDGLLVVATPAYRNCLPIGSTWTVIRVGQLAGLRVEMRDPVITVRPRGEVEVLGCVRRQAGDGDEEPATPARHPPSPLRCPLISVALSILSMVERK